jgi:cytohesin
MLEHVANIGAENEDRKTTFHKYVNARDAEGKTPLHLAPEGSYSEDPNVTPRLPDVARLLLGHGADVKTQDNDRSTPLHTAARHGRIEVVRVLLEHGADVGEEDYDCKTASQVASYHSEIRELLSKYRVE